MLFRVPDWPAEIWSALKVGKSALIGIAVASVIINLLMLTAPIFMLQVYDRVLPSRSLATLGGLFLIAFVLFVIQAVVDGIRGRLLARLSVVVDESIRGRVFDTIHAAGLVRSSEDGLQPARDLDTMRSFVSGSGLIAFFDLPWTPFYILVCFLFHPWMGVAVMAGALTLCAVTYISELLTRGPALTLVPLASQRRSINETSWRHAESVLAMGMGERLKALWTERTDSFIAAQNRVFDLSNGFGSASRFARTVLQSGVLALGAYLVVNQQATAGVMLAATILSIRALSPIEMAIANWRGFIAARDSFARIRKGLEAYPEKMIATELPLPTKKLGVGTVSVTVPQTGAVVLHEISFALEAGSALAVIGPSGSGKSTLARALIGAWPAARGVIRLDGAAIAQWHPDRLGRSVGFLPQDVGLFRGTIAENISRFSAGNNSSRIIRAAAAADVHDMILKMPKGYETEVGDGGMMLSGGQRQRIALARALYGDPFFVVLDEPNSNLDSEGEQALTRAIAGVRARGGIVIVIAHRPTILSSVDHILVLNEGRVHAFGKTVDVLPMLAPKSQPQPSSQSKPQSKSPRKSRAVSKAASKALESANAD